MQVTRENKRVVFDEGYHSQSFWLQLFHIQRLFSSLTGGIKLIREVSIEINTIGIISADKSGQRVAASLLEKKVDDISLSNQTYSSFSLSNQTNIR